MKGRYNNSMKLMSLIIPLFAVLFAQAQAASEGAQTSSLGIAQFVEIADKSAKDGDIISSSSSGNILSKTPYDPLVIGVVSSNPAVAFNLQPSEGTLPVVNSGTTYVNVSNESGQIKKGDLITTSQTPGVGQKATRSGYVLGSALEDLNTSDPKQVGQIAASLNLHYFNSKTTVTNQLTDVLKLSALAVTESPSAVFKYVIAAVVVLAGFILGFLSFGRTAAQGLEALGRNPSASRTIHFGIFLNVAITVAIIATGIAIAYLILRL